MKPILTDEEAARIYEFRVRGPFEPRGAYREALIEHVRKRDYAASHELRVGRRQEDWTPEDVAAFDHLMRSVPRSQHGPLPPGRAVSMLEVVTIDPTPAAFLELATGGFEVFKRSREANAGTPGGGSPIAPLANVVLMDGRCLVTPVTRGDRISTLKTLCQQMPVFGFFLFFDAFMHSIDTSGDKAKNKATKKDALLAQIGTRELRLMRVQPYREIGEGRKRRIHWDPPYEQNLRDQAVTDYHDPYAELFVSVPTEGRPQ